MMEYESQVNTLNKELKMLQATLERIQELLYVDAINIVGDGKYVFAPNKTRAELKNKMIEARRDMIRIEKIMYGKEE